MISGFQNIRSCFDSSLLERDQGKSDRSVELQNRTCEERCAKY